MNLRRDGTMKKRMPLRSLVAGHAQAAEGAPATGSIRPQKNRDTETRISPDVHRSASSIAALIRSGSIVRISLR